MLLLYGIKNNIRRHQILQRLFDLSKLIIRFKPYYLVNEGDIDDMINIIKPKLNIDDLVVCSLGESDMENLSQNIEIAQTKAELIHRLKNGWHCMGIRYNGSIISYLWYHLKEVKELLEFQLNDDEAYISDVRTLKPYRGKNLAPYLRYELYNYLRSIGKDKFYSIILCYNKPAIQVMKKINARPVKLILWIHIKKRICCNIVLKSFV